MERGKRDTLCIGYDICTTYACEPDFEEKNKAGIAITHADYRIPKQYHHFSCAINS